MAARWTRAMAAALVALGTAACGGSGAPGDGGVRDLPGDALATTDPGVDGADAGDGAADEGPRFDADLPGNDATGDGIQDDGSDVPNVPDGSDLPDPPNDGDGDAAGSDDAAGDPDVAPVDVAPEDVGLAEIRVPAIGTLPGSLEELPVPNDSGFFRTALLGDRWVLATPDGHAFVSLGPTTVDFGGDVGRGMTYSSMTLTNRARYGDDDAGRQTFFRDALGDLGEAGFNTVGGWSGELAGRIAGGQVRFPYTVSLAFSLQGAAVSGAGIPDVFDPAYAQACRDYAASATAPFRDDPLLIGYFTDNELKWWGENLLWKSDDRNLADDFLRLPADAPGKKAWVAFLQEDRGYTDAAGVNAAWGTAYASWDEVAAATELANDPVLPARAADKKAFVYRIARAYFETVDLALRSADPNHMNLCVRFATSAPIEVAQAAAPCDVLTINDYYSNDDDLTPDLFGATPEERWTGYALAAGGGTIPKPTMLTEFGLRATDSMLPNGFGAGFVGSTQSERGTYYRQAIDRLLGFRAGGLGFVVGFHWFEWRDEPKTGRWDGEDSNYGLVGVDGWKYQPLWQSMATQNAKVADRLLGGTAPVLATPVVRVTAGADGQPGLAWDPVPGANDYTIRLSPVPWMAEDVPWMQGLYPVTPEPVDQIVMSSEPECPLGPMVRAAGSWWATVTARHDGLAFDSDASIPVRIETPRNCPDSLTPPWELVGCFQHPPAPDSMKADGWARITYGPVSYPVDWFVMRFTASALGKNHPRNGGAGTEIVLSYRPPAPIAADALPRFCAAPVIATDGVREPASRFLKVRLRGADGALLSEGPLDPDGTVAAGGCQEAAAIAPGPVTTIDWVLFTGDPRLPLDVPLELMLGPFRVPSSSPGP